MKGLNGITMKKIAIMPNATKDTDFRNTYKIVSYLQGRAQVFLEDRYAASGLCAEYLPYDSLFEQAEIMLTLGGDGTMLQIAAKCAKRNIPVLGINLGKVGFLTEIELDRIEDALERLLSGEYEIEKRMLMRVEVIHEGQVSRHCHALNDVVVAKNVGAKLIDLALYADGELVNQYIADGLIIATPTGSTGYSISAGGPVVDPLMQLYVATPICAHMLAARSAVLPAEKEIVIRLNRDYPENGAVVSADGDVQGSISPLDEVRITRSCYQFSMIKIGSYSFYDTVLKKLS